MDHRKVDLGISGRQRRERTFCSVLSTSELELAPRVEEVASMKLLHVAVDVYEEQIRAGRYFSA